MKTPTKPPYNLRSTSKQPESESITRTIAKQIDKVKSRVFLVANSPSREDQPLDSRVPESYEEATTGPESLKWKKAIEEELEAHRENETWWIVERPPGEITLTARWVFSKKRNEAGEVIRYKARLVARGYAQREGIDFSETYAPVVKTDSIRTLISICSAKVMHWIQFDVASAFLNGNLEETIYIECPRGIDISKEKCLILKRALYGLKQAPRCWHSKFSKAMEEFGYKASISDSCIYVNEDKTAYTIVHVDDGIIFSSSKEQGESLLAHLERCFKTKTLTGASFLGVEIKHLKEGIVLTPALY